MSELYADGAEIYRAAYMRGLRPDPYLWVDEWADEYMRIPRNIGAAEPGPYRTDRTPYAREPMRCLSPGHPARRVVTMVASQLMKTQVALNWIGACIHMAPANILVLLPSQMVTKSVSARISKTIEAAPALKSRVALPRSRDAKNSIEAKEFEGGTLYARTAGSAANLAELSARYVYGDEVDRWEADVDNEGDPITLAETRTSTFGRNAKIYFSSSPTIKGASRIADLFAESDQRHYYVPCPHCGEMQVLEWENLKYSADYSHVQYLCCNPECGCLIDEHHKVDMLARGEWRAHGEGDGETVGFHLNALYAPVGWVSWLKLAMQYDAAKKAQDGGDLTQMQGFYNTRLAKVWDAAQEMTKASELQARAESYSLGTVPRGALILTAAVDTQDNRLEMLVVGWGAGLERWIVDHQVIMGDPADERTWALLDEKLKARYRHVSGVELAICATAIDSGGHHTDEVYQFTRLRRWRNVLAIKGSSRASKNIIAQRPSKVDVNWKGSTQKGGAELWFIGTDMAKDWIYNRYPMNEGPGALHFSQDLPEDFYQQCVAERKIARYVKGHKKLEWVKGKSERNEALDLLVYNLGMAHFLGLDRYREPEWSRLHQSLSQGSLFSESPAEGSQPSEQANDQPTQPAPPPPAKPQPTPPPAPVPLPARRSTRSGYLSRR